MYTVHKNLVIPFSEAISETILYLRDIALSVDRQRSDDCRVRDLPSADRTSPKLGGGDGGGLDRNFSPGSAHQQSPPRSPPSSVIRPQSSHREPPLTCPLRALGTSSWRTRPLVLEQALVTFGRLLNRLHLARGGRRSARRIIRWKCVCEMANCFRGRRGHSVNARRVSAMPCHDA